MLPNSQNCDNSQFTEGQPMSQWDFLGYLYDFVHDPTYLYFIKFVSIYNYIYINIYIHIYIYIYISISTCIYIYIHMYSICKFMDILSLYFQFLAFHCQKTNLWVFSILETTMGMPWVYTSLPNWRTQWNCPLGFTLSIPKLFFERRWWWCRWRWWWWWWWWWWQWWWVMGDDDDDSSMDGMGYPISRMFRNWRNYLSQFTWNMKQIMFWLISPQGWP